MEQNETPPSLTSQGTKLNSKGKEVPHGVRLYSIASSRYGDSGDGKTCTLCVVRVRHYGERGFIYESNRKLHAGKVRGVCCDLCVCISTVRI